MLRATIVASIGLFVVACTHGRPPDGPGSGAPLRIVPDMATLMVSDGMPATQTYQVISRDPDGNEKDVTADATLTLGNPMLGTLAGGNLTTTTDYGGHTILTAQWNNELATSDLTIILNKVVIDPGAPADAPDQFGTAQPGGPALQLVYPETGVIVPANMGTLEFHFVPGAGQNLFELNFTASAIHLRVYFACNAVGGGCIWTPSPQTWDILSTAARGDQPVEYKVRGLDSNHVVGGSPQQTLQFTSDDLVSGIYYWAASQGTIMRYDFGHPEIAPEHYLTVAQTTGLQCVGCHVLSRDGKMLAVGLDIPGPAALEVYDVATKARQWTTNTGGTPGFPSPNGGNFFTLSPDNTKIASSSGTNLVVRSAIDGSGMTTMLTNATMPDWSPDGTRIAFARAAQPAPAGNPGVAQGSILSADSTTFAWQILVQSNGENNYYPSYAPDGNWIVFNRSANAMDSYDQPDARVYLVNANGGIPIALQNASPSGGDSWPKWSPQAHSYVGGQIFWLTFSSRRPYGLRGGTNAQVWMVGIDPARAAAGMDPSFAAFWLPFQDFASGNHIAQWTDTIVRPPCGTSECPTGEFCDNGECFPNPQ
jgi:WD40 repeat protein